MIIAMLWSAGLARGIGLGTGEFFGVSVCTGDGDGDFAAITNAAALATAMMTSTDNFGRFLEGFFPM